MKDFFGFKDKTVVITGAASGMGEAAARMLIELGAKVHAVGNRKKIPFEPEKAYYADLAVKEQIDLLVSRLPDRIDALFICQGMAQEPGNALLVQKVNFLSVKYLAEALAPRVEDNGSITVISSSGGFGWEEDFSLCKEVIDCATYEETIDWYENHADVFEIPNAYPFSKKCLNAYVKYKVFDPMYIDRKIRLNCICPGNTLTALTDTFNRSTSPSGDPEEGRMIIEAIFQERWNGRWADAEEMGFPMVAIGSRLFSYMSGQVIYLDYGLSSAWETDNLLDD